MTAPRDLTGQRFGRLTALTSTWGGKHHVRYWVCRCDCGGTATVAAGHLTSGHTTSCGCLTREAVHLAIDLTGQRFGRLTALTLKPGSAGHGRYWVCRCDCGGAATVLAGALNTGHTKSCGCLKQESITAPRDLTGQRFGRLTALTLTWRGEGRKRVRLWVCQCDCGGTATIGAGHLTSGHTTSCGCLHKEVMSARMLKHGLSKTPEMYAYWAAKNRCENSAHPSYENYGGRGIKFRFTSFDEFLAEIGPRPAGTDDKGKALYSVDRINNDGHYEPRNLRWATKPVQAKNSRISPPRKGAYFTFAVPSIVDRHTIPYSTFCAPIPVAP
jgi:hypothetical protein